MGKRLEFLYLVLNTRAILNQITRYLVNIFVTLSVGGFLLAAFMAFSEQNRFSSEAQQAIEVLVSKNEMRVALPKNMRRQVQMFLDAGVEPVLYGQAELNPQFFSQHKLRYALFETELPFADFEQSGLIVNQIKVGPLWLNEIDLKLASGVPLRLGQNISFNYSRPYRYQPLRASLRLKSDASKFYIFHLNSGTYELAVDIFSKSKNKNKDNIMNYPAAELRGINKEKN